MQDAQTDSGPWFREWFGSPYYKLLYSHRDGAEARLFIRNVTRHLGLGKGSRVLDLACGRGRHAMELHRLGFDVTGMDISEESIAEARAGGAQGPDFLVHDMRDPFPVKDFDAVLNLFTSFGYFHSRQDDRRTIRAVADALRLGGVLVIDFLNTDKAVSEMVGEEEVVRDEVRFNIRRYLINGVITKEITVNDRGRTSFFREEVDALTLRDFEGYFADAGLVPEAVFGDYGLGPFDADRSDRLIMIARRQTA